jgi:SAM-dependent methyltransferase
VSEHHYWNTVAAAYRQIGPPLMPSDEDARRMEDAIRVHARVDPNRTRALLLGVTPLLADMCWPGGTTLLAVDASMPFVREVWPGDIAGRRYAVQGDWRRLPAREAAYDLAVGDGSFTCLPYPDGIRAAALAVKRALAPGGLLVMRFFVRPDPCESARDLLQDLAANRVATFHQFKYRLLMAMQRSVEDGIAVSDVHRYWHELGLPPDSLPATPGWSRTDVQTIEAYRGSSTVHTFPSLREWRAVMSDAFEEVANQPASYVLGDRCPVIVWRPRS